LHIEGDRELLCGGSPLLQFILGYCFWVLLNLHVGEIHRVEEILYSHSPLSEPDNFVCFDLIKIVYSCRGDYTG